MAKTNTYPIPTELANKLKTLSQNINSLGVQIEANQQYFQALLNIFLTQLRIFPYDENAVEKKIQYDLEKQIITVEESPKIVIAANLDGIAKRN